MIQSLARKLADEFPSADRSRGTAYFKQGAVESFDYDGQTIEARVQGSRWKPYTVVIEFPSSPRDPLVRASCDCPRFDDFGICKHLYAVILAADAQGDVPKQVQTANRLDLVCLDDDDDDLDDLLDDAWEVPFAPNAGRHAPYVRPPAEFESSPSGARPGRGGRASRAADWRDQLRRMTQSLASREPARPAGVEAPAGRQMLYRLSFTDCAARGRLIVHTSYQQRLKSGEWGKPRPISPAHYLMYHDGDSRDRAALAALLGDDQPAAFAYRPFSWSSTSRITPASVNEALAPAILARLAATGRLGWMMDETDDVLAAHSLTWDDGPAYRFRMNLHRTEAAGWQLSGCFYRGEETVPTEQAMMVFNSGIVWFKDRLARVDLDQSATWLRALRASPTLTVPAAQFDEFVEQLFTQPVPPPLELPAESGWSFVETAPRPIVQFERAPEDNRHLSATVLFDYDRDTFGALGIMESAARRTNRTITLRNRTAEAARLAELASVGVERRVHGLAADGGGFTLPAEQLPDAVPKLIELGWHVEADGGLIRHSGKLKSTVSTGIDWFDLEVACDFGGASASLPALLEALRQGRLFVTLDDGTQGLLPSQWLERFSPLLGLGEVKDQAVRFRPSQALLLDALLSSQDHVQLDRRFRALRDKYQSFTGVKPAEQPAAFQGKLRSYQRAGLGWLQFLREFQLGGCLADDMGLGKTIQVLALLAAVYRPSRRAKRPPPSLVVAPRSLVHNWITEAGRFAPHLRVADYSAVGRGRALPDNGEADLVVTTYGVLRQDIVALHERPFHYAILDEAQAIKNPQSQSAKAARLLVADHRLALSGTPVENHLGDLWSLVEFLNPGMLGRSQAFRTLVGNGRTVDPSTGQVLQQAMRPIVLRRTKEKVLSELPPKTEQTLYCELDAKQRRLYNELRDHYRALLEKKIAADGLKRSKIVVLEALLRLRQAACHPGLIDTKRSGDSSVKLELLQEQLSEVLDEGHKALVFSTFTSLLALVRRQLDAQRVAYAYLDGRTRRRRDAVDLFQNNPDCKLFLISLKAGGLGLNLTAADYVFILDPWWNPAAEAQAVDRAHRIGQARPVFAYRLIARDTVEEKILQLQADKRQLAESIITSDSNLLAKLSADDLRLLLS